MSSVSASITSIAIGVRRECRGAGRKTLQEPWIAIEIALIIPPRGHQAERDEAGTNLADERDQWVTRPSHPLDPLGRQMTTGLMERRRAVLVRRLRAGH